MANNYDVIIVGAGAAGLMCAYKSAENGRKVLLIEKSPKIGQKIRISGGGRCNFTNIYASAENYISQNPHFCKSALSRFSPYDFIEIVEKEGIKFHEKQMHKEVHGQMFCDDSAQQIIDMLVRLATSSGATIITECEVQKLEKNDRFVLHTSNGEFSCQSLVIATGGLSFAKIGATDFGYKIAEQFGIKVTDLQPALVPLIVAGKELEFCKKLSGISVDCVVSCNEISFRENILFTHRGFSGPAILQISSYWSKNDEITINLLPEINLMDELTANQHDKIKLANVLGKFLAKRFVQNWLERYNWDKTLAEYKKQELEKIVYQLQNYIIKPVDSEGYPKAEVTCGGVNTDELSSKTMESKKVEGLFFIGEVVDVTGWLGGYNFQWAWASANAAGDSI